MEKVHKCFFIIILTINMVIYSNVKTVHSNSIFENKVTMDESTEDQIRESFIREYHNKINQHVGGALTLFLAFFAFRKQNYFIEEIPEPKRSFLIIFIFYFLAGGLIFMLGRLNFWIARIEIVSSFNLAFDGINSEFPNREIFARAIEKVFCSREFLDDVWRRQVAFQFHDPLSPNGIMITIFIVVVFASIFTWILTGAHKRTNV